MKLVPSNRQGD